MDSRSRSTNAGPSADQVRLAKKTFAAGSGKSSLPAAEILYGPATPPVKKTAPRNLPPLPPRAPSASSGPGAPPSPPDLPRRGPPRLEPLAAPHGAEPVASTSPRSRSSSVSSDGSTPPDSPRGSSVHPPPYTAFASSSSGTPFAQPLASTSSAAGPRGPAKPLLPSLGSAFAKLGSANAAVQDQFIKDKVDFVHGTNSTALPAVSSEGLQPVAARLDAFANSRKPPLPTATPEQRQVVAEQFRQTMTSGERGNTLDAWVKSPSQPAATGISVYGRQNASDTLDYARRHGAGEFPVVLGLGSDVPLDRRDVGHPVTTGRVSPSQIPAVYVPKGHSETANKLLGDGPLRGRAKSFPDLFEK